MSRTFPPLARSRARSMRQDATDAEAIVWSHIRNRLLNGFKFRRQVPIGPYIADFVCQERQLVVELDGFQHAESSQDLVRDRYLNTLGYRVLRFWNGDVYSSLNDVLRHLVEVLEGRA